MVVALFGYYLNKEEEIIVYAKEEVATIVFPTPTPTLACAWCGLEPYLDYVYEVFGEDAERGITMLANCENKDFGTTRINWNRNGTWDFGLWQINSIHGYTQEELADPYFNTDVAYKIFKRAGSSFTPWTCAEHAGDIPFYKL